MTINCAKLMKIEIKVTGVVGRQCEFEQVLPNYCVRRELRLPTQVIFIDDFKQKLVFHNSVSISVNISKLLMPSL